MSEYRYKYQGELNDAGKIVCCAQGCDNEARMSVFCADHAMLDRITLKPEHPSNANASYTIAHGFYATGPKGGK